MKVKLNDGREFMVSWKHRPPQPLQKKERPGTSCYLYELKDGSREFYCGVDLDKYSKDQYSKEVGRKTSLDRVLKGCDLSREERTIFWRTYFAR